MCIVGQGNGGGEAAVMMNNGADNGGIPEAMNGGGDGMMVDEGNPNNLPNGGNEEANGGAHMQEAIGGGGVEGGAVLNGGDGALARDVVVGFGGVMVPDFQAGGGPVAANGGRPAANAPNSVWADWAFRHYQRVGGPLSQYSAAMWQLHFNVEYPHLRD